jgi:YidC/Oxa1 family membrane protein insertase
MFDIIARVLAWYYSIWPSYGMAIVFLTLTVMVLVLPLTLKATRSMLMMQALQPEIKKLQAEHRDDRQKLNEEMLALYRQNKINPLSGCLPLLIQFPVFIVLYQVLRGLTYIPPGGDTFEPKYIKHDSDLYQALSQGDTMVSWGIDLSKSATQVAADSFVTAIPYLVLILAVAATTYIQQKQISARNPNSDTIANPQQRLLLRIMPAFMAFISLSLPAALVVYFLTSNLFRVGQQALISHAIYKPAVREGLVPGKDAAPADEGDAAKPSKPSKPAKAVDTTSRETKPARPRPAGSTGKSGSASRSDSTRQDLGSARGSGTGRAQPAKSPPAKSPPAKASSSGRAQPAKKTPAKSPPATPPPATPAKTGFFGRLMGGGSGDGAGGNGASTPAKPTGPPRAASGRVTPPGSTARKKKRK